MIERLEDIKADKNIFLYGAGEGGKIALDKINKFFNKDIVTGFVDDSKSGEFCGLPICNLADVPDDIFILVTSAYWHLIIEKVNKKIDNWDVLSPVLFYDYLIFSDLELASALHVAETLDAVFEPKSFELYKAILSAHHEIDGVRRLADINNNMFSSSIEYLDHINCAEIKTVIEGGVLDGKNSVDFIGRFDEGLVIYGFEPIWDLISNRHRLKDGKNLVIIKKALSQSEGKIFFDYIPDSAESSRGSNSGNGIMVDTINIDNFVMSEKIRKIDFIKLDIEGAELPTLKGAESIIIRDRPQLAISIYHSKQDLVEIPVYMSKICKNYTFFIGHYSKTYWDTVLYAIPNEKISTSEVE